MPAGEAQDEPAVVEDAVVARVLRRCCPDSCGCRGCRAARRCCRTRRRSACAGSGRTWRRTRRSRRRQPCIDRGRATAGPAGRRRWRRRDGGSTRPQRQVEQRRLDVVERVAGVGRLGGESGAQRRRAPSRIGWRDQRVDHPEDDVGRVVGLDVHGDPPRLPGLVEDPHLQMRVSTRRPRACTGRRVRGARHRGSPSSRLSCPRGHGQEPARDLLTPRIRRQISPLGQGECGYHAQRGSVASAAAVTRDGARIRRDAVTGTTKRAPVTRTPAGGSRPSPRGADALHRNDVVDLQRMAGNRATAKLVVQRDPTPQQAPRRPPRTPVGSRASTRTSSSRSTCSPRHT